MACIAGTVDSPRRWVRFAHGQPVRMEGRWCDRAQDFTSRRTCSSCPAYRGIDIFGQLVTGMAPNGEPLGLTADEYAAYEAAVEASFDDDFSLMRAWFDRMDAGVGERALREHGDPDATDRWAAYMRGYRERMDDEQRERDRDRRREYMRDYMRRRRAAARDIPTPGRIVSVSTPGMK